MINKQIVISGINLFQGGPLSIYTDLLDELISKNMQEKYDITIFVHQVKIFEKYLEFFNIVDLPKSRRNWLYRIYYEYIYFKKYSKKRNIHLWVSLHDITPVVKSNHLVTYCHNPSFSYESSIKDFKLDKKFFLFTKFYRFLYRINIKKNDYVIVQQNWIADEFRKMYQIENIIIYSPQTNMSSGKFSIDKQLQWNEYTFFYPSISRSFKNFEVICQAVIEMNKKEINEKYKVILTIDGTENKYAKKIFEKYRNIENIEFVGLQPRQQIYEIYSRSNCLIFPSKLETWGLPITEAKEFNIPMIVSDLPYAYETVNTYHSVTFFNPNDAQQLSKIMLNYLFGYCGKKHVSNFKVSGKQLFSWKEVLDLFENKDR